MAQVIFEGTVAEGDRAMMEALGEQLAVPAGLVYGIFDPEGTAPAAWSSEVGLASRVSQQPSPVLLLIPEDATGIEQGAAISLRGKDYIVSRIDGADGLVRLELMADTSDDASPPDGELWR